jgi:hypothetical protein
MTAVATKGLAIYLHKGGVAATELVPTAISKASPAVVTVASATGLTKGDVVKMESTGFKELDGKTFVIGTVDTTANTFQLIGADTTASTGTLGATPKAHVYKAADQIKLCLSSIDFSTEAGGSVSVGTFCDPSATIATPAATAGTVTLNGFIDKADTGYAELLKAAEDGVARMIEIVLPQDQGYIVAPVTLSSLGWQTPLEGAIGFTASGSLGSKPVHLF